MCVCLPWNKREFLIFMFLSVCNSTLACNIKVVNLFMYHIFSCYSNVSLFWKRTTCTYSVIQCSITLNLSTVVSQSELIWEQSTYQFGTVLSPSQHLESLLFDFIMHSNVSMTTGRGIIVRVYVALSVPSFFSSSNDMLASFLFAFWATKVTIELFWLQPQGLCWCIQRHIQ